LKITSKILSVTGAVDIALSHAIIVKEASKSVSKLEEKPQLTPDEEAELFEARDTLKFSQDYSVTKVSTTAAASIIGFLMPASGIGNFLLKIGCLAPAALSWDAFEKRVAKLSITQRISASIEKTHTLFHNELKTIDTLSEQLARHPNAMVVLS
jgi:hypothetical protein